MTRYNDQGDNEIETITYNYIYIYIYRERERERKKRVRRPQRVMARESKDYREYFL